VLPLLILNKSLKRILVNLPSRSSLSYSWNFGSILAMILGFQIIRGTVLVFFYVPESIISFDRVQYLILETNLGWLIRIFHFNGASFFFYFCLFTYF